MSTDLSRSSNPQGQESSPSISARHTYAMGLTAGIGTGLWIATSAGLFYGGAAGLIFGFGVVGVMLAMLMSNIVEMIVLHPHKDGFFGYINDFCGRTAAFAAVINYLLLWAFCFPAELVAATEVLKMLWPSAPTAAFLVLFMTICLIIHIMPAWVYGESEFLFAVVKLTGLSVAVVTMVVLDAGGFRQYRPQQQLIWASDRIWGTGIGPLQVFLSAGFAMGGIELFTLAVGETKDPRASARNNLWAICGRLLFCYLLTVTLFATVVYSGLGTLNATTSPVFEALALAKVDALRSVLIVFVLLTLISAGNTVLYLIKQSVRRTIKFGILPVPEKYRKHFTDSLCWPAIVLGLLFGSIAFMTLSKTGADAFQYLMGVVAMANYITWTLLLVTHCRFKQALHKFLQNRPSLFEGASEDRRRRKDFWWVWNAYIGVVLLTAFIASHVLALMPPDGGAVTPIKVLCKVGIIYIILLAFICNVLCHKVVGKQSFGSMFPKLEDLQSTLSDYHNARQEDVMGLTIIAAQLSANDRPPQVLSLDERDVGFGLRKPEECHTLPSRTSWSTGGSFRSPDGPV